MNYIVYLIGLAIGNFLALFPLRVLFVLSDIIYFIIYYVIGYRKKVVFENLRNSFPHKTDKEIEIIARKFYRHFCDILMEMVKLFNVTPAEMQRRIKYRNPEVMDLCYAQKKHILVVLGHYNNWEWGCSMSIGAPYEFTGIYKPLSNPYFDKLMAKLRCQFGGKVVPMKQSARYFSHNISTGKFTQLYFIADQSPMSEEVQYWTTFLNQDTPVYLGIEKMARKYRQPVIYAHFIKIKRGYYEVELTKLCDDCSLLQPYELTEMHIRKLEAVINEKPEYWLWTHRRWKIKKYN